MGNKTDYKDGKAFGRKLEEDHIRHLVAPALKAKKEELEEACQQAMSESVSATQKALRALADKLDSSEAMMGQFSKALKTSIETESAKYDEIFPEKS
ncbi:hypothetical protein DDV21_003690 [Streptococcus chenjunshii]|uniref:Uncharacterized protein n=1 Tax=Streptococcus chenjunshii TaxID=2173853 RepID=A0A346NA30_9STRE|nr:hypothetical protein [Streptococcus chenjunshii]AXQ77875.1 hypothetical protein DDV21_001705 [Streptococcus chenjunshii]AXQ78242.1 hypothetical protein DDV21_003690 [Streptococcus chenjunshii]RFU49968.1 hypothetical protein DDV22_11130 [Streptococcus chenjunshii]RFU52164.1 hypothetical protein DDV23_11125 [Streptococcus chenjunshii]